MGRERQSAKRPAFHKPLRCRPPCAQRQANGNANGVPWVRAQGAHCKTVCTRANGKVLAWQMVRVNTVLPCAPCARTKGRSHSSSWPARKDCRHPAAGPPARNSIFQWADQDHRDHRDRREMASHACAPSHWLDRRHWDNGRLARCVDRPCTANATRKMRVVPVSLFPVRSTSQAQSRWSRWSRRSR